jgi:hypothetical protein
MPIRVIKLPETELMERSVVASYLHVVCCLPHLAFPGHTFDLWALASLTHIYYHVLRVGSTREV